MRSFFLTAGLLTVSTTTNALTVKQHQGNSQLQNVIDMLKKMQIEGDEIRKKEEVQWATESQKCKSEISRLKEEITEGTEESEELGARISNAESSVEELSNEIEELQAKIGDASTQKSKIKKVREENHKANAAQELDLRESVDALTRAVGVIQQQHAKNKNVKVGSPAEFLQTSMAKKIPSRALSLLSAIGDTVETQYAYESSSGGVLKLLNKLLGEFESQVHDTTMTELQQKQNWELATQNLASDIDRYTADVEDKQELVAKHTEDAGTSKKELAETQKDLKEDNALLLSTTTSCDQKKRSFDDKQDLRREENEAMFQAVRVLGDVPASMSSPAGESFFLQIAQNSGLAKDISGNNNPNQQKLENAQVGVYLRNQADKIKSKSLMLLADKIAEDPFAKVKVMVREMIDRLNKEMLEAEKEKGFCVAEFKKVGRKAKQLSGKVKKLTAAVDTNSAQKAELLQTMKKTQAKITADNKAMNEANAARANEAETNATKIREAQEAQAAVSQAIEILQQFYSKAKGSTAFLQLQLTAKADQTPSKHDPSRVAHGEGEETFGDSYEGKQDKSNVVMSILQVVMSDFGKQESDTQASESESKTVHDEYVKTTKKAIAAATAKLEFATSDQEAAASNLVQATMDLKDTNREVENNNKQRKDLLPMCPPELGGTKNVVSFEERSAQKQEEIESLKAALEMLAPRA